MVWLPLALYMFWGPFVVWSLLVALAALTGAPSRLQVNVVAIAGAVLGLVAVTVGWEFHAHYDEIDFYDIPGGLWIFMFASWLGLLSPIAGFGGVAALIIDLNSANNNDFSIIGDGYSIAVIAAAITLLSVVFPFSIGRGYGSSDRSRKRRLLTVRAGGFRTKGWTDS